MYAIVFGCEELSHNIYGKHVDIETDHKSLEAIIKKPLSQVPVKTQRLLRRMQRYVATLTYRPGKEIYIVDALSCACLNDRNLSDIEFDNEIDFHAHCLVKHLPLTNSNLRNLWKLMLLTQNFSSIRKLYSMYGLIQNRKYLMKPDLIGTLDVKLMK